MRKPATERIYTIAEIVAATGYTRNYLYALLRKRKAYIPKSPRPGVWTQSQLDRILEWKQKAEAGRPRGDLRQAQTFRIRPHVLERLLAINQGGGYRTRDGAIEHVILHADKCEDFIPGESHLAVAESNAAEKVDLSGL